MPSALEPRMVDGPGRGVIRHIAARLLPPQAWANARNVRFPTGQSMIQKTDGYRRVDQTLPTDRLRALWWYVSPTGGPSTLVRIGCHAAWKGLGAAREGLVTFPATPVLTVNNVVTIDQYRETLLWADGVAVWSWDGSAADAAPLESAPIGTLVELHKEHVLIGHLTVDHQPWRVVYSRVGHPTDFTGEGSGFVDFLEDDTGLTALKVLGDHAIVHKPNRLYRMVFVGPPNQYIVEGIPADDGACGARAAISIGSYQFYMGRTNFYRLATFSEPIGDAVWPEVEQIMDWTRASQVYAYRRLEWDEICWKVPARSGATPQGVLTVVFNFRDQTWSLHDHDPGTCFTEVPADALPDLAAPDVFPVVIGVFGQISGNLEAYGGLNADGRPVHAWAESPEFTDELAPAKILAVPLFATGTGFLDVTCRAAMDPRQPMPAWGTPSRFLLAQHGTRPWIDVREYGRLWQVRLASTRLDDDWQLTAYGTAVIPGGYAR